MEIINKDDSNYLIRAIFDNMLDVAVYANCEADALEIIGEYCYKNNYLGLLYTSDYDKLLKECDNNINMLNEHWYPINGGEFYLNIYNLYLEILSPV